MSESAAFDVATEQLVVVGASAGGIEALSRLVESLPAELSAPVVVAQHLDPARPSHLAEILARHTALPVRTVTDREDLSAGTVFVVPSNRHVSISDHVVRVHADVHRRPTPSVDLLLTTAADIYGERLIAVILSGSGTDGAAGAHAVKEAGGTVVIQDPDTAAFPSMPRSLAPSLVDISVPVERIGPLVADLLAAPRPDQAAIDPELRRLLRHLRERHGIDFTAYKLPTIMRRLWRRVAAADVPTIADYRRYLEAHPEEEQRLIADFLIKVTRFFRDPALFARLREEIIPELVDAARAEGRELRVWSAGCATGEEAYSLAVLVAEALGQTPTRPPVRIFATDLDETALAFARRGVYPASALADMPPELVERYFAEHDGAYEVTKQVRGLIVFGNHDLAQRPPFPAIDLVMCRNVLIYFTAELQRRALEIFAYSLRERGFLVLGKAETAGSVNRSFVPVDRRLRIYRRQGPRPLLPPAHLPSAAEARPAIGPSFSRSRSALELALQRSEAATADARFAAGRSEDLVRRLPVGVAVVNRDYDLETINGAARELLGIHGLALGQDLIHLAQHVPSPALRTCIDAVLGGEPSRELETTVTSETATGQTQFLTVSCHPERVDGDGLVESVLVLFADVSGLVRAQRLGAEMVERQEAELTALRTTVERMASGNRQLLAANRELTDAVDRLREQSDDLRLAVAAAQVSSEEIETLNEELQSSNEELETLHEEAQATVEELNVSNDELQARTTELEELAAMHSAERSRLTTLLAGMGDAVLVVDHQGRAVRTNPAYDELMRTIGAPFVPTDDHNMPLPPEELPERRVTRGEAFQLEFAVQTADGGQRWFDVTGRPLAGEEAGVLVIRDITDRNVRRLQEEFLLWASHELRTPLTALLISLQSAERLAQGEGSDRLRRYLAMATEQTRRQTALIDELLDATRLHTGRLVLNRAPLDLGPLAARTVEQARVVAQGQAITIESPNGPVMVDGDAGRLEQVLMNLLMNAIAYAPGTEEIGVRVRRIRGDAEVTVQDQGPGIPAADLETIFARFAQLDPTAQRGTSGLGLGLYITREIVQAHGGTIAASSAPGRGARFTIRLPLAETEGGRRTDESKVESRKSKVDGK
jgi:two-component system CheB/CheR fusion protein